MNNNPLTKDIYLQRKKKRESDIRGDYFRDQTAIIHSMPFRRLKHKTQVFFAPENDHVCTRMEHVLHVATISATICKGLNSYGWNLDIDLAFAIGLGHDLGHAPFGHSGEYALNTKRGGKNAFVHEVNSYRVVEYLTNNGKGINLTYAVKDGIICHNGEKDEQYLKPATKKNDLDKIKDRNVIPSTYEGCIVRMSDKIAYLGRDIEDALIAGFIKPNSIPKEVQNILGDKNGDIINNLVIDVIENSKNKNIIGFSDKKYEVLKKLKKFNYKYIYNHTVIKRLNTYCNKIIFSLFDHLYELINKYQNDYSKYQKSTIKLDKAFGEYLKSMNKFYTENNTKPEQIITDYISGMTDQYALDSMKQITIPSPIFFEK